MSGKAGDAVGPTWDVVPDTDGRFSTGTRDFDRILDGGFRRGSFALFNVDSNIGPPELNLLLAPTWLNFLHQSRGLLAVLPARDSPAEFRRYALQFTTRRLFDSRVRIVDYIGEADPAPYVVPLREANRAKAPAKDRQVAMGRMADAEKAVAGARGRPFLEMNALEVMDTLVGPETASRMLFHGIKRTRAVGNLGVAIARPGLGCVETARGLVDYEFQLTRSSLGLEIRGRRPEFPPHLVVPDRRHGPPRLEFVPPPGPSSSAP